MKTSVISVSSQGNTATGLLLTFPDEETAEFQLEVGENQDVTFSSSQVHQRLEFCPWPDWGVLGLHRQESAAPFLRPPPPGLGRGAGHRVGACW